LTTPREERCRPANQDTFHHHDTRRIALLTLAERLLPPAFAPALSLTPPSIPRSCDRGAFLMGIARSRCGHPRVRDRFESTDAFSTLWVFVPGTDDPSAPVSSTGSTVDEDRLPRSHRCQSQRLDGFYDREFVARWPLAKGAEHLVGKTPGAKPRMCAVRT
jgi:hypothetical protein